MQMQDTVTQVGDLERYVYNGRIDIPNTYSAGTVGSHFLTELRDNKHILGMKCEKCNVVYVPPRSTCKYCFAKLADSWVEVGDKGTLLTYTVNFAPTAAQPVESPIIYGIVQLDGATTGFVHMLGEVDLEDLRIGMRMQAVFQPEPKASILAIKYFKPL